MRWKKIVLLTMSTFNKRDYKRFGVEILKINGFDVEIWDLTEILYEMRAKKYAPPDKLECDELIVLKNKKELLKRISKLKREALVVCFINYDYNTLFIYRALSKKGINYVFISCIVSPPESKRDWKSKYSHVISSYFKKLYKSPLEIRFLLQNHLIMRLPPSLLGVKQPDYLLLGGRKSILRTSMFEKSNIIWGHTFDYDNYLENEEKNDDTKENWAVFLDHGTPYQPDYYSYGKTPAPAEIYYPHVLKFLNKVEKETGLEVVIAAHPRWNFEKCSDHYEGKKVIRGETVKLVKKAKFIIAHNSTSINYAILYKKPLLFIMSPFHKEGVEATAKILGKKAYKNAKTGIKWEEEFKVSDYFYGLYKDNYIKRNESTKKFLWQIFVDHINM